MLRSSLGSGIIADRQHLSKWPVATVWAGIEIFESYTGGLTPQLTPADTMTNDNDFVGKRLRCKGPSGVPGSRHLPGFGRDQIGKPKTSRHGQPMIPYCFDPASLIVFVMDGYIARLYIPAGRPGLSIISPKRSRHADPDKPQYHAVSSV